MPPTILGKRLHANKDKWLLRLAIVCGVLVAVLIFILIFDIINPSVGFVRY